MRKLNYIEARQVNFICILSFLVMYSFIIQSCLSGPNEPREVWISNLIAKQQDYWQTEVKLIGVVQDIQVDPKGTKRGYYMLMDTQEQAILVKTRSLPNVGENVVVVGIVGQNPQNATTPIIEETDRQWVWTSFLFISLGILMLICTFAIILFKYLHEPSPQKYAEAPAHEVPMHRPLIKSAPVKPKKKREFKKHSQMAETTFIDSSKISEGTKSSGNFTVEFEILAGPDKGKRFHFTSANLTVGRSGKRLNDIELKDITISREQARLELNKAGKGFVLHNEGKTNPTLVNGKALAVSNIKSGDEILVGTTLIKYTIID